uniref:RLF zinc finger n=1 Tax=Poecilia reticulata TaxID=8081 RepID=A0A3P9Q743_POERE
MAENNVEAEHDWNDWALDAAEDTVIAMETLLATLRAFEDVLRQQEISVASSTEYCDNFCQALMHYAGSRNSIEHGLPLLEVYCLSINCFAAARSHLTAESDRVGLVLKRLALSCFELLLSVPDNEIPYEAWLQFHHSVQIAHDTLIQYGSTDLQALLQITGEGGAWSNPILNALLTGQTTSPEDVNAYISLEGEGFMEMRVKHLEKMGEVAKAGVLAKACAECSLISNQGMFRQIYVSQLCLLLPNEEAIMEISRLDCKDVLDITSNLESEGEENTAFILCTTFLTQQLQQQSLYCSWDLISLWSKLQRRLDPSLTSLRERCLQLGAIAKTVQHLLYLVRVIQAEAEEIGVLSSVGLCVKALQLPKQDDSETRTSICKMVSSLLPNDLEVLRACQLTEFLLGTSQEAFNCLKELYMRPDQKYDEGEVIPNSLRCELLLALKADWPFDPEFWDWKTLKNHCVSLLGIRPESEEEEEDEEEKAKQQEPQGPQIKGGCEIKRSKLRCQICKRSITDIQIIHHSKRHSDKSNHPCPVCLEDFRSRKDLIPHLRRHIPVHEPPTRNSIKTEDAQKQLDEDDDVEPGEITVDPSLMLYYESTHDPDVLHHIVEQAKNKEKQEESDEHITFDYIDKHFKLQNREVYPCPATKCTRIFKHSKYLYVHLKSEHKGDENVKYFHQMRDKREKCVFCRRHFVSAYHHRKHRKVHYGDRPYMCVVHGCGARFGTSNELVMHKHTHGFQLNYQCELKGCYVTYSDLGQIYHHEAQHFRDAAFTCSGGECKKYFLSKRDFLKHLSTHNKTFTETDFEAQRRAKRKFFKAVREVMVRPVKPADVKDAINGDILNSQSISSGSSLQEPEFSEPKAMITLVAVCFDGSKFTCGFEKCGMTFTRARDVQRHLKCAHPEHLKLENRDQKNDKVENPQMLKEIKMEMEQEIDERGEQEHSPLLPVESGKEKNMSCDTTPNETTSLSLNAKTDALNEILIGLSNLTLDPSSSHSSVKSEAEQSLVTAEEDDSLASAKPYLCEIKRCGFRTARNYSLLRHYVSIHNHSPDEAKLMTSSFKPYKCQLCAKSHREKRVLKAHYLQVHKMTEDYFEKLSFEPFEGNKGSPTPQHSEKVIKEAEEMLQLKAKEETGTSENGENGSNHSSMEEGEDESENKDEQKEESEEDKTQQIRTRRVVAKSNLCYMLDKLSNPFHCVAKNCYASFSTQGSLVRHLQLVHHYNRSQLLLEKDGDAHSSPEARREPAKKRPLTNSDEPQPQFKCHFAKCSASYHLKSSLVRHTRDVHSRPPDLIQCKFDGCSKVFSHNEDLKKHTLYSHFEYYDSLVVRLQSTHKESVSGCQKKVIVAQKRTTESDKKDVSDADGKKALSKNEKPRRNAFSDFVLRSHEEALQMCQDRCLRVAYPCMVQDCDSVVTYLHSLQRHYKGVHRMEQEDLCKHEDNPESLEILEKKNEEVPPEVANEAPKEEEIKEEPLEEVLEVTRPDSATKQDERSILDKFKPLLRPVTVALSPPCSLHVASDDKVTNATPPQTPPASPSPPPTAPIRQPLKRKNELSEQPLDIQETKSKSPSPTSFDIGTYKPMGFEESFLKFIQDSTPAEEDEPAKRKETLKRGCSLKEDNQLGISHTRSRRAHSPLVKPHAMTGDFTSVQNLKSILDKALAGCGDLAIKQLQYLRPVVVLGRPVSSTTTPDLFPSKTNSKLLLGS